MESAENRGQAPACSLRLEDLVSSVQAAEDIVRAVEANSAFDRPRSPSLRTHLPVGLRPALHVRECDWKHFKSDTADERPCVVDVLVAGADLPLQMQDEAHDRMTMPPMRMMPRHHPRPSGSGTTTPEEQEEPQKLLPVPKNTHDEQWIHRIRIRSAAVLKVLNAVSGYSFDVTKSHTFTRPFATLLYHHEKISACLEALEAEAKGSAPHDNDSSSSGADGPEDPVAPEYFDAPEDPDDGDDAGRILRELRLYVRFVTDSLLPDYRRFENSTDSGLTVRYDDLWYLYRPGDLVYHDPLGDGIVTRGKHDLLTQAKQRIMRVVSASPHTMQLDGHNFYRSRACYADARGPDRGSYNSNFKLLCYWLDFNGDSFVPEWYTLNILPYPGKVGVRSLNCRPIRFTDPSLNLLSAGIATGRKVFHAIQHKRMSFDGPCLLFEPTGENAVTFKGEPLKDPERYDGEVYIDLKEAIKTRLYWSFNHNGSRPFEVEPTTVVEDFLVMKPTTIDGRPGIPKQHRDLVVHYDAVATAQGNDQNKADQYIMNKGGSPLSSFPVRDEDFALLSRRIYAYLLRYRVFMAVDVDYMQPISPQPNALDDICLDETDKKMLRSAVHGVLRRAVSTGSPAVSHKNRRGVVVMIHGAPGSGKTATVEAIANAYNKPLFVLGADDFVNESEETMVELEVAKAWNCPLLVDDVDIVLPRSKHDSRMNQQVTTLMHVLDHFPGLIFLTTSRLAALDESIKSRVHLTISLKPLTLEQTLKVFKLNLDRLREEEGERGLPGCEPLVISDDEILQFATEQYNSTTDAAGRWNGRQIRNAVQMATDLAHYEVIDGQSTSPRLRAVHFKAIAKMVLESEKVSGPNYNGASRQKGHASRASGDRLKRMVGSRGRGGDGGVDDESDVSSSMYRRDEEQDYDEGFQSFGQWSVVAERG